MLFLFVFVSLPKMVNGLHLYSAFIQGAVQIMPFIHPHTHTHTHQRRLAAMQGTNQLVRSKWGLGVLLRDTSIRPGRDRTGNPPTARRQLLPPEPYHPHTFCLNSLFPLYGFSCRLRAVFGRFWLSSCSPALSVPALPCTPLYHTLLFVSVF